jgi:hypothetical protein
MLNYLQTIPGLALFFGIMFIGLLISTIIPAYVRWKFNLHLNEELSKGASDAYKFAISITLLLCAF